MGKKLPHHKDGFSKEQVGLKLAVRRLRTKAGYGVGEFAKTIGVSRKKYEDMETLQTTYGCYISWDMACICADTLGVGLDKLRRIAREEQSER